MSSTDPAPEPQGDPDLGEAGKKAIAAERRRADLAEKQVAALQTQLDQVTAQVADLTSAAEAAAQQSVTDLAQRDLQIARLNVGIDKGLSRPLINRLQGEDQAGFEADADELLSLMPPTPVGGSPRPDPSQGSRKPAASSPKESFAAAMGDLLNP